MKYFKTQEHFITTFIIRRTILYSRNTWHKVQMFDLLMRRGTKICFVLYIKGRRYLKIAKCSIIKKQTIHQNGTSKYYI